MIKILFFGSIADRLVKRECSLPVEIDMTFADVLDAIACADFRPVLVAVNQNQVNDKGKGDASFYLGEGEKS